MPHAHQLVQVVQARTVLRVVGLLQQLLVAGHVQHRGDHPPQVGQPQAGPVRGRHLHRLCLRPQRVHHLQELANGIATACGKAGDLPRGGVTKGSRETDPLAFRVHSDLRNGLIPDAAPRGVDDAPQRHRVVSVIQYLEISHDVADLAALVEARTTDDLVRHAGTHQHVLDRTRGVVGAVHDRDVAVGVALVIHQVVDLLDDEVRLVMLVIRNVTADQLAIA